MKANAREGMPSSLQALEKEAGIKLVVADSRDPENVVWKHWRAAFYCAGAPDERPLGNFLLLLDVFFAHKSRLMKKDFAVKLCPHIGVDIRSILDDLEYGHYEPENPSTDLPLKSFEAQPLGSKKIVTVHVQVESDEIMSLLLAGNTWSFRAKLDEHGVPGCYFNEMKVFFCSGR